MMVREKNCYYAIALTDFFVFLSCAEINYSSANNSKRAKDNFSENKGGTALPIIL